MSETIPETISKSVVKRLRAQSYAPNFCEVYLQWLAAGIARKRKPFRPETARSYKSQIETNVLPVIGGLPIDTVGNKALNALSAKMADAGLSPATIQRNINNIKDIRKFLKDDDGQPLYPYSWDAATIDAPDVDKDKQKRPVATAAAVQAALKCTCGVTDYAQALLALLAGSGLRIQEALALRHGPKPDNQTQWLPGESKILVRDQRHGAAFGPTKTKAGVREVDLPKQLNDFLMDQFEDKMLQTGGSGVQPLLFPESESFYRNQFEKCGIKGGFHSLRRFRVTHLRMNGIPDSLTHFWIGHEDSTVTGRYTEVGSEIQARKTQAEKVGLGFQLETEAA